MIREERQSKLLLLMAFAAVYVLWGSTYLSLRFALETIPPFLMVGFRFLLAGSIMIIYAKLNKHSWPRREEIKNSAWVGILLLVLGNGGVVYAEQYIDSGITALIITIEPVWVILLLWIKSKNERPSLVVWLGILLGLAGMMILIVPSEISEAEKLDPVGVVVLILSSICWALGSVYALRATLPSSAAFNTGFQMLIAGACLLMIGSFHNEWSVLDVSGISNRSIGGFLYLVICGSLIGFTSYTYIVKNANPSSVSTYAYVNPVVAVFLGWWLGNESLSAHTLIAAFLLVSAVVLIIMKPSLGKW
jgi:drug/metabolite transporter (DMT)-like permease